MWHRVFSLSAESPPPSAPVERLVADGLSVIPHFKGDDLGWTAGEFVLPGGGSPILVHRYLTAADDLRADLNTFAAELETMTYSPNYARLMQHVIQTQQLVTLRRPLDHADEAALDRLCLGVIQFLAARTEGVYQIDGRGWFAADGELLLQEY